VLVLPQVPLSFANSCLATADAARVYFGQAAERVRPGRLATTFGGANVLAGALSGMPVCHGAGGLTAHVAFGARTGGAPVAMGVALLTLALGLGAGLASLLAAFPLPILAGVLATAGILHIGLLRDLETAADWALALAVGAVGFTTDLATALLLGLAVWWLPRGALRLRAATAG
jgi:MFS superfamily sulfate permease-like transporter